MPEFNEWFPSSRYGTNALNVMDFGAIADGAGHSLGSIYSTLPEAQADYPSATNLSDYVDWCAITECFKQAFQHETSPGVWEPNATASDFNKPVFFPAGRYVIDKPLWWESIQGAWIFGSGSGTVIHNEMGTPGNSSCVITNGFCYNRIENITFGTVGGEPASHAFDLNWGDGALVAANACTFSNCHFSAPLGIGISMADPASFPGSGNMSSEIHFYHCTMNNCAVGIYIAGWNALNYSFIGCGGIICGTWLQVSAGGAVTVVNGSLSGNGLDIDIGAEACTVIATRTESKRFIVANGPATLLDCTQGCEGNDCTFIETSKSVFMQGCQTTMGRLHGEGSVTIDGCTFNLEGRFYVLAVTNSTDVPGRIRVTHQDSSNYSGPGTQELWLDGDELTVRNVTGTGAASINGTWKIHKINHNTVDLIGSTFGGTYTNLGIGNADIKAGPRFHLVDPANPTVPPKLKVSAVGSRSLHETKTSNFNLLWLDSGTVYDNFGATGEIVFTLPDIGNSNWGIVKGARYTFIVLTAQSIKIQTTVGSGSAPARIFRAGGYATAGAYVSSNVVGNSIEIYQADSPNVDFTDTGHRWVVLSETGTWTIAGTPA